MQFTGPIADAEMNNVIETRGGYAVKIQWSLFGDGKHSVEVVKNFVEDLLGVYGNDYEIVSCGVGSAVRILVGKYAGWYDIYAYPGQDTVLLLQDRG